MRRCANAVTVLMVDDDPDDCLLVESALKDIGFCGRMCCVEDGMELLDYLNRRDKYEDSVHFPHPTLILLDLNMPRKDGRETLKEIKSDPDFRRIPLVIFTTSQHEEDSVLAYDFGASSFMIKPTMLNDLVVKLKSLTSYWLECVELPPGS